MAVVDKIYLHIGPMFSGKTTRLRIELQDILINSARRTDVGLFRPKLDTRNEEKCHNKGVVYTGSEYIVTNPSDLLIKAHQYDMQAIGIDEWQFWPIETISILYQLLKEDRRITVVGLDTDFCGESFPSTRELAACPEVEIYKWKASCKICFGKIGATRTLRFNTDGHIFKKGEDSKIKVGSDEMYGAVCYNPHFIAAMENNLTADEITRLLRKIKF